MQFGRIYLPLAIGVLEGRNPTAFYRFQNSRLASTDRIGSLFERVHRRFLSFTCLWQETVTAVSWQV
jgi:hypothetical protein